MADKIRPKGVRDADQMSVDSENEFLSSYSIEKYERPSVAADVIVFSMFAKSAECHRKDDEPELSVLLIKRGEHPYMNKWALPGGFLRPDETLEECALRELSEETGLYASTVIPVGVFSDPDRDPRGRIVSNAFVSIISEEKVKLAGGSDAIDAKWFSLKFEETDAERYSMILENSDERISAELKKIEGRFANSKFEILSHDNLAFDHARIIATALTEIKSKAENFDVAFEFLPEKFTLASLQRVQEELMGTSLLTPNFRRKIMGLVCETDERTEGAGHRPAMLFRRRQMNH